MNGIPLPLITETGAEQQISQIVDHLNSLAQETERMFSSIDFQNLNADLATRINSSFTEHQSLEAYASSAKLKKVSDEMSKVISTLQENLPEEYVTNEEASLYVTHTELLNNYWTAEQIKNRFYTISETDATFAKKTDLNGYASLSDFNELKDTVNDLEDRVRKLEEKVADLGG